MIRHKNQRLIIISKEKCSKSHPYSMINLESLDWALANITSETSIKLWLYMAKNQNKYEFVLSSKVFMQYAKCSKNAYRDAFKLLREKGCLVNVEGKEDDYIFYEMPKESEQQIEEKDKTIHIPEQKLIQLEEFDISKTDTDGVSTFDF